MLDNVQSGMWLKCPEESGVFIFREQNGLLEMQAATINCDIVVSYKTELEDFFMGVI